MRRGTLDPDWSWSCLLSWDGADALRLRVWDFDAVGEDDFMGEVLLDPAGLPRARQTTAFVPHEADVRTVQLPLRKRARAGRRGEPAPTPWREALVEEEGEDEDGEGGAEEGRGGVGGAASECCRALKNAFGKGTVCGTVKFSLAFMVIDDS